jgi:hypothetical protein
MKAQHLDEYVPDQIGLALRPVHTIAGDGLHGIATACINKNLGCLILSRLKVIVKLQYR